MLVMLTVFSTYYLGNLYLNVLSILLAILFAIDINKNSIDILIGFIKNKLVKHKEI